MRGDRSNPGALFVEYRPAAALIPFAKNARPHSDAQVAQTTGLKVGELSSFGTDGRGRTYVTSINGPVYRLVER